MQRDRPSPPVRSERAAIVAGRYRRASGWPADESWRNIRRWWCRSRAMPRPGTHTQCAHTRYRHSALREEKCSFAAIAVVGGRAPIRAVAIVARARADRSDRVAGAGRARAPPRYPVRGGAQSPQRCAANPGDEPPGSCRHRPPRSGPAAEIRSGRAWACAARCRETLVARHSRAGIGAGATCDSRSSNTRAAMSASAALSASSG